MTKKLFVLVLSIFMILPLLFACGSSEETTTSGETDSNKTPFGLEKKNWNGREIVFATVGEGHDTYSDVEIAAYESTGSYVNDASYQRYTKLLEEYGIDVKVSFEKAGEADAIKNAIIADTCDFDIIVDSAVDLSKYALDGLLYDLADIDSLNLQNPWWDYSSIRDLSIKNHVFFVSGDILVSDKGSTWVTFFNKDMYNKYFPDGESLYDVVKSDRWTLDYMYELCRTVSEGNKSLSNLSGETGTFGAITQTYDGIAMMMGFGQKMIGKDADDVFVLNIDNDPTKTKFLGMYDFLLDGITTVLAEKEWNSLGYPAIPDNASTVFKSGRGLFQPNRVAYVQNLSESNLEFQYGVLPLPKYDEVQENYCSPTTVYWSLFVALPSTTKDENLEFVSYVLEAMGYYGQELLQPAYYDITIKSQKMTDAESEDMLDIIFNNRIWDPAAVYDFGSSLYMYTNLLLAENNGISSAIEENSSTIQTSIDNILEQIQILEEDQANAA